jgi:HEAT repeat protein
MALRRHGFSSQTALAQELGISRSTTGNFFMGKSVKYSYFVEVSERLGLDWEAIAYIEETSAINVEPALPPEKVPDREPDNRTLGSDWRQVCCDMLQAQNQMRLTTNPLTAGDGVVFELDEIYVSLGLVKRKQRNRVVGDVSPEQGSRIYRPEAQDEIVQTFQQDEFFERVLRHGRSQRIAIIGEPGAGKTTLLQKIAAWVLDNTEDTPILISLADLQGKSIERYLLSNWLKAATRKVRVPPTMQEEFGGLFNSKQVWLLLDGADEMVMGTPSQTPLQWIANQLTGWVADARVVLTCRLNLWDVGKNALEAFETYHNLDFSYGDAQTPDQVGQFIRCWFKSNPQLAERLRIELNQPGKVRIRDALKNPLRLALLCRSWTLGQGELPTTKAGLYQQFTEALYEWKQDRFPTNSNQRQELNRALGELALRAISEERTKFRLRHRFVCSVLGEPDTPLFRLALQLGWLNQVGIAAESENLGKSVYAFYHPTFQEYFAALAIDDWHYFFNHSPNNPTQGTYRIFEPQWKEVILLWLGREDVAKEQKEDFIKTLVEFEDGCKDFYKYRAYFLAAAGISEFGDCDSASEIVEQVVKLSFGYFNFEKQKWRTFIERVEEGARAMLTETPVSLTIASLVQLISSTKDISIRNQAAFSLWKIDPDNQEATRVLVELLSSGNLKDYKQAAFRLGITESSKRKKIRTLVQLISSTEDEYTRIDAACRLGKTDPGNPEAIRVLVELISSTEDESTRSEAAYRLEEIDPGNQEVIKALRLFMNSGTICGISRIGQAAPEMIRQLVRLIGSTEDESKRRGAIKYLKEIGVDNLSDEILSQLIYTINKPIEKEYTRKVFENLAVAVLVKLIKSAEDESTRREAADSLGKIGTGNPEAIAALMQLIKPTENESTRLQENKSIRRHAAHSLKKILRDEQLAGFVTDLKNSLSDETYENDIEQFEEYYELIWHCAQIIPYPDFYLTWHNKLQGATIAP